MINKAHPAKYSELEKLSAIYEHLILDDLKLEVDTALKEHWNEKYRIFQQKKTTFIVRI